MHFPEYDLDCWAYATSARERPGFVTGVVQLPAHNAEGSSSGRRCHRVCRPAHGIEVRQSVPEGGALP
eukprot:5753115-Pyramimonas_sp.AAC.1